MKGLLKVEPKEMMKDRKMERPKEGSLEKQKALMWEKVKGEKLVGHTELRQLVKGLVQ